MSNLADDQVAVIIAAYNAADTITAAVSSALAQDGVGEVCVIDDASSDKTAELARCLDDGTNRLHVRRLGTNSGPSAARNLGFNLTRSPWVTILDADDRMLPGRITAMLQHAAEADIVADELVRVAPDGRPLIAPGYWCAVGETKSLDLGAFVQGNLAGADPTKLDLGFCKPLVRREFLVRHALSYDEGMRLGEDFDLYARGLAAGARFVVIPACGYLSVERAHSLSKLHSAADLERLRASSKRLARLENLRGSTRQVLRTHVEGLNKRLYWAKLVEGIKQRQALTCLRSFLVSPTVSLHLTNKLAGRLFSRLSQSFQ